MQDMAQRWKKIIPYVVKFIKYGSLREMMRLARQVNRPYFLSALAARLDKRPCAAEFKNGGIHEINFYLDSFKHRKKHMENGIYLWEVNHRQIHANLIQFEGLKEEYLKGEFYSYYDYDWQGKIVLDIGGFVGDTALYFLEKGAKKVVIYEPLLENIKALHYNLRLCWDKIDLHQKAIAEKDGLLTLTSLTPIGSPGFGMIEGKHSVRCHGIALTTLLASHAVDVVKMDCEGGEKHLCEVDHSLIRAVPYWIVETHSPDIYKNVTQKFKNCQFIKLKDLSLTPMVNLIHFSLS